jgi:hypothetical protein
MSVQYISGDLKMTKLKQLKFKNLTQSIVTALGIMLFMLTACSGTEPQAEVVPVDTPPIPTNTPATQSDDTPPNVIWRMDPAQWQTPSTQWKNTGEANTLCEGDPTQNYGKAESEIIDLNVDDYPLIYVSATAVDPESRYILQLLDKSNDQATDVLKQGKTGTNIINLTKDVGWSGQKKFTMNVWIEGEAKCTTFEKIVIGTN